jgi:uracil-DNA glycosylase
MPTMPSGSAAPADTGGVIHRRAAYDSLVAARKACRACEGLENPSRCAGGVWDAEHIGPWSRWQGNLNAAVMVVGQDWGSEGYFTDNRGCDKPNSDTSSFLTKLLASIDVNVSGPTELDGFLGAAFFTNAILCLKAGDRMSGRVKARWLSNCGTRFLRPSIELISPRVLISLGVGAYRAIARLYGLPKARFVDAVDRPDGWVLSEATRYFPMFHCGPLGLVNRRREAQQDDWGKVRRFL